MCVRDDGNRMKETQTPTNSKRRTNKAVGETK